MHSAIMPVDSTHFEFDGVLYYNKHFLSKKEKLRNLLSTSKIIKGTPSPNEISWGFLLSNGEFHITKDKNKFTSGVLLAIKAKRFDLMEMWHSGQIYQKLACQTDKNNV